MISGKERNSLSLWVTRPERPKDAKDEVFKAALRAASLDFSHFILIPKICDLSNIFQFV